MTRLCLDTSAYSELRKGHSEAIRLIRHCTDVGMTVIVLGELRAGFRIGSLTAENETGLSDFLRRPVVRILDVDGDASVLYAELFAELRRAGLSLPTNDLWIAAIALREGAQVLTFDAHFRAIPRIGVILLNR